ncbi:MAG: hypothetical protein ACTHOG_07950, partial [Marmoricola sp.]
MSTPVARQPRGIPAGGQYAPAIHAEPETAPLRGITDPFLASIVNSRHHDGEPFLDLGAEELSVVRDHLASTGDFSYRALRIAAEEAYLLERHYTPAEYERYLSERGDTTAWHGDPDAVRRDIEQMRKDDLAAAAAPPVVPGPRPHTK